VWSWQLQTPALVALCILAQFSSLAHLLLVHHDRCAVHGELIHTADQHAHAAADSLAGSGAASAFEAAPGSESVADDEHCTVLGHRREQVTPAVFATLVVHLAEAGQSAQAPCVALPARSIAGYLIAPKTSPPV
jgi:hypothetical protein